MPIWIGSQLIKLLSEIKSNKYGDRIPGDLQVCQNTCFCFPGEKCVKRHAADGNGISDLGNCGGRQNVYRRVQEEKPPAPDPLPHLGGLRHDHQPSGSVVSVRRLYGGHLGGLHHVVSALCHVLLAVPCTGHCIWLHRQILLEDRRKVQPESLPAQHIDGSFLIIH